jgi:hypothetical protein
MHRFPWIVAAAAMLLAGLARAQPATKPTTQPTTQPLATTRPADPRVAALVSELADDAFATRQRAEDALVELGPEVIDALADELARARDGEAQARLQSAITRLAEIREFGASRITLRLVDVPIKQAYAELARQAGTTFVSMPPNLLDSLDGRVTLEADRQRFWEVFLALREQTGLDFVSSGEGLRLASLGNGVGGAPVSIHEAFLVRAESASLSHSINYGRGGSHSGFSLQLAVLPEPKLAVSGGMTAGLRIESCLDDNGNELADPRQPVGVYTSNDMLMVGLQLQIPPNLGRTIRTLRGTLRVPLPTRFETIELEDPVGQKKVTQQAGELRVVIDEFRKSGDRQYTTKITLHREGLSESAWAPFAQHAIFGGVQVLDADGQPLSRSGWGTSGDGKKLEGTLTFRRDKDGPEPLKLQWRIPVETKEIEVPIEFKDLPLPGR